MKKFKIFLQILVVCLVGIGQSPCRGDQPARAKDTDSISCTSESSQGCPPGAYPATCQGCTYSPSSGVLSCSSCQQWNKYWSVSRSIRAFGGEQAAEVSNLDGHLNCSPNFCQARVGGFCCPNAFYNKNICGQGPTCGLCPSGQTACGAICCPTGQACVNNACCPNAQACGNTCCPTGQNCCGGTTCCPSGSCTSEGICCNSGQIASGSLCCTSGDPSVCYTPGDKKQSPKKAQ